MAALLINSVTEGSGLRRLKRPWVVKPGVIQSTNIYNEHTMCWILGAQLGMKQDCCLMGRQVCSG